MSIHFNGANDYFKIDEKPMRKIELPVRNLITYLIVMYLAGAAMGTCLVAMFIE